MPKRKTAKEMHIPMIPLRGVMIFPHMVLHFDVGRELSVSSLQEAMMREQKIFLVAQKDEEIDEPQKEDLYTVGTICQVKQVINLPGNALRVLAEGIERADLVSIEHEENFLSANILLPSPAAEDPDETTVLYRITRNELEHFARQSGRFSGETLRSMMDVTDPAKFADITAANLLSELPERQSLLNEYSVCERLEALSSYLNRESQLAEVEAKIQGRLKIALDKNQKDFYLREQIHCIQEELGDTQESENEELRERLEKTPVNQEARDKVLKELSHLEHMAPGAPEISVLHNWIEWVLDLPWEKSTTDQLDLKKARKILDDDHYGMQKIKDRIIEYLAVLGMKKKNTGDTKAKGPILCFVGPPGVGKTSIVRGIAKALGRKFVQMSLGGVRDEAQIRGHRRTYVGAIPGRIISGMKQAGVINPVFLFDEIDKMSSDFKGDPASAMLEVLDGEQNFAFRDHYLDIPYDLSNVIFITTANSVDTIPAPLLDRMELIEVPSYTEEEKLQIAKRHLIRKQLKEHSLLPKSVKLSDRVLKSLIQNYTREAGVRTLDRTIGKVVRKAAVDMLENGTEAVTVTPALLETYLGAPRFHRDAALKEPVVGVVNGLAYTTVGGETLMIECTVMEGSGQLQLTGQLGDVMKESAKAAFSWVRAHHAAYQIKDDFYKTNDVHIHVPEGAVPKDGPSAGVTMTTALVSALSGKKVRQDLAMTGEITLTGRVLPIGGVKEKLLAAYRAGIRNILLPKENMKDLEDIPPYVLEHFTIDPVSHVEEVLKYALIDAETTK